MTILSHPKTTGMFQNQAPIPRQSKPALDRKTSSLPPQDQAAEEGEARPLMFRHISMAGGEDEERQAQAGRSSSWKRWSFAPPSPPSFQYRASGSLPFIIVAILVFAMYFFTIDMFQYRSHLGEEGVLVRTIDEAEEQTIDVGGGKEVWCRTWGTYRREKKAYRSVLPDTAPAVLFVHGGPGQAVADYQNGNKRFFDAAKLFVVEVDQRGTGKSRPSVRDDYRNMEHYRNVSIDLIARDFEAVRKHLGIDRWVVWGGSFGSTIALNYCMLFPGSCVALLLRGIYLDTKEELSQVYSRRAFEDDDRKLAQFDILYDVAREEVERDRREEDESAWLDPNDFERLLRVYERMILRGDERATWTWHSFENNLMEDDPKKQLDPDSIVWEKFPEARSVAFFETRLWLHGSFEDPSDLLARVDRLDGIPVWICQGVYDNVCPARNAWSLVEALKRVHHRRSRSGDPGFLQAYFLDANHEDTDPTMENCLKKIMSEFLEMNSLI